MRVRANSALAWALAVAALLNVGLVPLYALSLMIHDQLGPDALRLPMAYETVRLLAISALFLSALGNFWRGMRMIATICLAHQIVLACFYGFGPWQLLSCVDLAAVVLLCLAQSLLWRAPVIGVRTR